MKVRILLAALPIAVLLAVGVVADGSDADDRFYADGFICEMNDDGTVALLSYEPKTEDITADVIVPEAVTHEKLGECKVTKIYCVFTQDWLKTISIPKTIEHLETPMFQAPNTEEINIDPNNPYYSAVDNVIYGENGFELLEYPKFLKAESFTVPDDVVVIKRSAFSESSLKAIMLPPRLFSIERLAFINCGQLSSINEEDGKNRIPDTVNVIDDWAFYKCTSLDNLILPEELRIIGKSAFMSTGLKTIEIPEKLTTLGEGAFSDCKQLREITCEYNNTFKVYKGVLFKNDAKSTLICYPAGKEDSEYRIGNTVGDIAPEAFSGCVNLKTVVLPNTMIMLSKEAFKNCHSLENINLRKVMVISESVFDGCTNLKSVEFGPELISIGQLAFANSGLEEVKITSSIQVVDNDAFSYCSNLEMVEIEEGCAAEIYQWAFSQSYNLNIVSIYGNEIKLLPGSLDVSTDANNPVYLYVIKSKDYSLPKDVVQYPDCTILEVQDRGERPYPYENFVAIFVCILIIIGIFKLFRGI